MNETDRYRQVLNAFVFERKTIKGRWGDDIPEIPLARLGIVNQMIVWARMKIKEIEDGQAASKDGTTGAVDEGSVAQMRKKVPGW